MGGRSTSLRKISERKSEDANIQEEIQYYAHDHSPGGSSLELASSRSKNSKKETSLSSSETCDGGYDTSPSTKSLAPKKGCPTSHDKSTSILSRAELQSPGTSDLDIIS